MKLHIESDAFGSQRFMEFITETGMDRLRATGLLTLFWQTSQARELVVGSEEDILSCLPILRAERQRVFDVLILVGYLVSTDLGYEIRGNRKHVDALSHFRKIGKRGGESSYTRRRTEGQPHGQAYAEAHAQPSASAHAQPHAEPYAQAQAEPVPISSDQFSSDQFRSDPKKEKNKRSVAAVGPLSPAAAITLPVELSAEWIRDTIPIARWREILKIYDGDEDFIKAEASKMAVWVDANRHRAPKSRRGWSNFITSWLSRGWERHRTNRPKPVLKIDHDALWGKPPADPC